ncbi:unnamed protein product [Adineta ricciae]|nr:unnamed protein product [Adineta ricciae]
MASSKSNQNRQSLTKKTTTVFPLPNATKPRYRVVHKTEINEFSDDLILSIFRYLSPIDLLNVGIICRRWHAISQDESLWRSLVHSYGLHQTVSNLTSKQLVQKYLNRQINIQLQKLFPVKFDKYKSYTGVLDYETIFQKYSDRFQFCLAFCDDKHNVIWSQKYETIKFFDISMSVRWLEITMPDLLTRIHFLRLFVNVSIKINTRPNRTRLPQGNEQLADVTEKPIQCTQTIQSLLREYKFEWNLFRTRSVPLTKDPKSPILISRLANEDDLLIGYYEKDKSIAFVVFNINYLSFRELFFAGLRTTDSTMYRSLSNHIVGSQFPRPNDMEVSVFICLRNMTTKFLRHRFVNCRIKYSPSPVIEMIRITDMNNELGPELSELPKFNWKTGIFKGTITDIFLIDVIVLNEDKNVSFSVTLPATLTAGNVGEESSQGSDYILSSNVWNIKAASQCNNTIQLNGTIMRLDSEYCALGRDSQSWHLQNMTCSF